MLRQYCQDEGMLATAVGIVASGENSALPHYKTGGKLIAKGDAVVIDFGADYKGYQTDMTRTVAVKSIFGEFKDIYQIVLEANNRAFEAVRVGATYESIDAVARNVISDAGYGQYFTHRLGHGIGLDVHEHPYIVKGNQDTIKVGNVFSDEPGIYIKGRFGIRIEDIIAVTGEGPVRLTDVTREIKIVD